MGDLEEKLNGILSNPQAMAQIMQLAQSLNLGGNNSGGAAPASQPESSAQQSPSGDSYGSSAADFSQSQVPSSDVALGAPPQPPPAANQGSAPSPDASQAVDGSAAASLLGGLSLDTLSAAAKLLGGMKDGQEDRRTALLLALRPFVREERYAKLDKAVQIARLSRLIRSGLDLFRPGGESHV